MYYQTQNSHSFPYCILNKKVFYRWCRWNHLMENGLSTHPSTTQFPTPNLYNFFRLNFCQCYLLLKMLAVKSHHCHKKLSLNVTHLFILRYCPYMVILEVTAYVYGKVIRTNYKEQFDPWYSNNQTFINYLTAIYTQCTPVHPFRN